MASVEIRESEKEKEGRRDEWDSIRVLLALAEPSTNAGSRASRAPKSVKLAQIVLILSL